MNNNIEEVTKLVERFMIDKYHSEEKQRAYITRLRNLILRNGCFSLRDIYLKEDFKGAKKGTQGYNIISSMKNVYGQEVCKRERLEEIDKMIRTLSKERKGILMDLES